MIQGLDAIMKYLPLMTLLVAVVSLYKLYIILQQINEDHRRARRERTLEALHRWLSYDGGRDRFNAFACKLLEMLTEQEIESVCCVKPLKLEIKHIAIIKQLVSTLPRGVNKTTTLSSNGTIIELNAEIVRELRSAGVYWLNHLELLAVAWRHSIADDEILEDELRYIILLKNKKLPLQHFIDVIEGYPSLRLFKETLLEKERQKLVRQQATGITITILSLFSFIKFNRKDS